MPNHDQYIPHVYEGPIDDMCRRALTRLHDFRQDKYESIEIGDIAYSHLASELDKNPYERHARDVYVSAVASAIHEGLVTDDDPPSYLVDLTAHLITCGFDEQAQHAGNTIEQLLPSESTIKAHVIAVWGRSRAERISGSAFEIHRFISRSGTVSVTYAYDPSSGTWVLGYGMEVTKVMLGWKMDDMYKPNISWVR